MQPRQLVLLYGSLPLVLGVVAVHAENLELAGILGVILLHLREALDAPHAPRAPEVEDDILAAKRREGQRLAVDVVERELRSLQASGLLLLRLLLSGLLLEALLLSLHQVVVDGLHAPFTHRGVEELIGLLHLVEIADAAQQPYGRLLLGIGLDVVDQRLLMAVVIGQIDLVVEPVAFFLLDVFVGLHLTELERTGPQLLAVVLVEKVHLVIVGIESRAVHVETRLVGIPHAHLLTSHERNGVYTRILHVATQNPGLQQHALRHLVHLDLELELAVLADESLFLMSRTIDHDRVAKVHQVEFHFQRLAASVGSSPSAYSDHCEHHAQNHSFHSYLFFAKIQ